MTEADFETLDMVGLGNIARNLAKGSLVAQWKPRKTGTGMMGPYISFVLRTSDEKQEWFYLGKPGTARFEARLERVISLTVTFQDMTNAELSEVLRRELDRWVN